MRLRLLIALSALLLVNPMALHAASKKAKAVPAAKKTPVVVSEVQVQKEVNVVQGKEPVASVIHQPGRIVSSKFDLSEAQVYKLEGTVMVQHADGSQPTALGSFDTVTKGDIITVFDKSWVILKSRRGDKFGLDGNTVLTIDEYYMGGPDRQIRLVLQKGILVLKTNNADSRQSFFEINAGTVVTSIGDASAIFFYDKAKDNLTLEYMRGKLKVIDKNEEQKFTYENTIHHWEGGVMQEVEPSPMDELDGINFKKFLNGEKRLPPTDTNILLMTGE